MDVQGTRQPPTGPAPWLLTIDEAAALTRLSRRKVYDLLESGAWPTLRIGTARRIHADSLRAWIEEQVAQQAA